MSELLRILLLLLPAILHTANGHSLADPVWCLWSSDDFSDMELIRSLIFNKIKYIEYNSTAGKFVGYTEIGIKNAERFNNDTAMLKSWKADLDRACKHNAQGYSSAVLSKAVEPRVKVTLVKKSDGTHPARLMCSAYSFYPPHIEVTWLRNGQKIKGGVTSTEEMADGDWYYQIHSHLEYMPESGEEISCVVQHASFQKPMVYKWGESDHHSQI
ncbi:DLA class II histocompatibility antigen, DR-1 beta chain-like [Neoarius graeffei]|uniref:DLA class II histocompatibility antigen, DR-1 beta chain-like n=1 Tax=Neoarius graeffei TaxID=443677 RepID=UPI00298D1E89|nr:DLA class II histocompatibility antigen, DR-1 beta chain-like [Neoarius graeffei]